MSEAMLGEIRMFCGNFAPRNWMFCNGQTLQVNEYQALYAVVGNIYGGTPSTNFALPDLRGRLPVHAQPSTVGGTISNVTLGQAGGNTQSQPISLPVVPHAHAATFTPTGGGGGSVVQINVTNTTGTLTSPIGNMLAQSPTSGQSQGLVYAPSTSPVNGQLAGVAGGGGGITGGTVTVAQAGTGNTAVATVVPPYLPINFIICVNGLFPSRN